MKNPEMRNLPSVKLARFPQSYETAKKALSKLVRIDECAEWANKAEAMASYAKQADDKSLYNMSVRIRARAIRRCGDLLEKMGRPKQGGRPKKNGVRGDPVSKKQAAEDAGLSVRQRKTAIRVSNLPKEDFEAVVESDNPPTVTELAKRGKKTREKPLIDLQGRDPKEFHLATEAQGTLRRFVEFASAADQAAVVRGSFLRERRELRAQAAITIEWSIGLIAEIDKQMLSEGETDDHSKRPRKRSARTDRRSSQRPSR